MAGLIDSRLIRREFIAGGTAGGIGIFLGFPFDLIKVNLQTNPDKYGSAWQCYRQIIKAEGYAGLYRGCIPPVMMQGEIKLRLNLNWNLNLLRFMFHRTNQQFDIHRWKCGN